jgi:hypothetical protein
MRISDDKDYINNESEAAVRNLELFLDFLDSPANVAGTGKVLVVGASAELSAAVSIEALLGRSARRATRKQGLADASVAEIA